MEVDNDLGTLPDGDFFSGQSNQQRILGVADQTMRQTRTIRAALQHHVYKIFFVPQCQLR